MKLVVTMGEARPDLRLNIANVEAASAWGFNCGPGALWGRWRAFCCVCSLHRGRAGPGAPMTALLLLALATAILATLGEP